MMLLLVMMLLKSLLVCAAAGLLLAALRRSSAAARHLVCLGTLAALLALPLFSLTLPGWHLPVLKAQSVEPTPARQEPTPPRPSATLPKREGKEFQKSQSPLSETPALSPPVPGGPLRSEERTKQGGGFLLLYLFGLLLASARPLLGLWGIRRLRRGCAAVTDAPTLGIFADCASLLGVSLPCLYQAEVPVPMTWGWRRPVVVLPLHFAGWPEGRLRSVLLHELAHVRRRDWPGHRAADLACAVYWFHPLVWMIARHLRAESEAACDDLVLASGIPAPDYARHLLAIAQTLPPAACSPHSAIAMAQTSRIERRLLILLDTTQSRRTLTRRVLLLALVPSTAALVTLAVLRPEAKAQTTPAQITPVQPASSTAAAPFSGTLVSVEDLKLSGKSLLAGITDANKPGGPWWSASGAILPAPVYDTNAYHAENHASPDKHAVSFAFRLPAIASGDTVRYELPQSTGSSSEGTWVGKMGNDVGLTEAQQFTHTGGARVVTAAYPAGISKASVRIGVASGPWKLVTEIVPGHTDTSATTTAAGSFIVGPLESASSGYILSVSASQLTQDIRIVGVDIAGRDEFPTTLGDQSIGTLDQISAHFNLPMVPLKAVRVETRPFQWIEYKDVALKPVQ